MPEESLFLNGQPQQLASVGHPRWTSLTLAGVALTCRLLGLTPMWPLRSRAPSGINCLPPGVRQNAENEQAGTLHWLHLQHVWCSLVFSHVHILPAVHERLNQRTSLATKLHMCFPGCPILSLDTVVLQTMSIPATCACSGSSPSTIPVCPG